MIEAIIIILIIIVLISYFSKNTKKQNDNTLIDVKIKYDEDEVHSQAKEKAEKITTYNQLEKLEEQMYDTEDRLNQYEEDEKIEMYAKTFVKFKILEEAYDIAENKPYRYYIDTVDFDMSKTLVKKLGKLITPKEYDMFDEDDKNFLCELTLSEADNIDSLKEEVRDGVNDDDKEIVKLLNLYYDRKNGFEDKINKLIEKSEFLQSEIEIDQESDLSNYEQFLEFMDNMQYEKELKKYGIPRAPLFIEYGYKTIEDIKKLTDEEILAINGVGEKTLKNIRNALVKYP